MNNVNTLLYIVQGLFNLLWSVVSGLLNALFTPLINQLGLPSVLPQVFTNLLHSVALVIDAFIPIQQVTTGLGVVFLAWTVWVGFRCAGMVVRLVKTIAGLLAAVPGAIVGAITTVLAFFGL
jgi:phage-related protein